MKLSDRLIGPALIVLGAGVAYAASGLPAVPGVRFGADLMPTICGAMLIIFGAVITRAGLRDAGPAVSIAEWRVPLSQRLAAIWAIGGLVAGGFLFEPLGFVLFGVVVLGGGVLLMGARGITVALVAPIFVIALHLLFTRVMFVDLPAGVLEGWL
jgi:putative tricarboxylic transport membrane protein